MPEQTAISALAAAIRTVLTDGGEARLDGLGTLRRTHVPARVEVRPDATRVLHPPRHGVEFEPEGIDVDSGK